MTREYIMQVTVDADGHEHGITRVQELVRCGECKHHYMEPVLFTDYIGSIREFNPVRHMCELSHDEIPVRDFFCRFGER